MDPPPPDANDRVTDGVVGRPALVGSGAAGRGLAVAPGRRVATTTAMSSVHDVLFLLATQAGVDPNRGTALAQKGAVQRLAEPTVYDLVFPFIAFLLVIVLPTATALWVIGKTLQDRRKEPDEV